VPPNAGSSGGTPQQFCGAWALDNNFGSAWMAGCINGIEGHWPCLT
jgi:hypothetical protein